MTETMTLPREVLPRESRVDVADASQPRACDIEAALSNTDRTIAEIEARIRRDSNALQRLIAQRESQAAMLHDLRLREEAPAGSAVRPHIILVVDPNDTNLRFLSRVVERAEHIPDEATSGAKALEKIAASPIDLIIADIELGDMDGVKFAQAIRAMPDKAHIPIVLVTHALERRHIPAIAEHVVQGHLVKPVRRDHMLSLTAELIADAERTRQRVG